MPTPLDRARRWVFAASYLLFGTGGVVAMISPPASFAASGITSGLMWAWAVCLAIGGSASAVGAGGKLPIAELAGLIALATGLAAYAVALLYLPHRTGGTWLITSLVLAVILVLVSRYLEIMRASRVGRVRP